MVNDKQHCVWFVPTAYTMIAKPIKTLELHYPMIFNKKTRQRNKHKNSLVIEEDEIITNVLSVRANQVYSFLCRLSSIT